MYVCVCVCLGVCMHVFAWVFGCKCGWDACVCDFVHVCVFSPTAAIVTHTCTHMYTHTLTHTHKYLLACTHTKMLKCIIPQAMSLFETYLCHKETHTHTHTHKHAQTRTNTTHQLFFSLRRQRHCRELVLISCGRGRWLLGRLPVLGYH